MADISNNQGALLLGACFATGLSGVATVQAVLYFKLYPKDERIVKALVLLIWSLDITHTGLVLTAVWNYLIVNFGQPRAVDKIPLTLALTISFTAITTFAVHCFFAHRIFRLSRRNWYLTIPTVFFAVCRLCSACATSGEMVRVGTFSAFKQHFRWLFSLGLALSTLVDILITVLLFMLLQSSRSRSLSLDHIIDSLVLYTLEIGSLTSAGTIVSLICWLSLNGNLAFLSLHFVIGKLYANSLLASLNTRAQLRNSHSNKDSMPVVDLERRNTARNFDSFRMPLSLVSHESDKSKIELQHVQINVEKSVSYDTI